MNDDLPAYVLLAAAFGTLLGIVVIIGASQRSAAKPDGTYVSDGQCVAYQFAVRRDTTFYEVQCTRDKKPQAVVFLPKSSSTP